MRLPIRLEVVLTPARVVAIGAPTCHAKPTREQIATYSDRCKAERQRMDLVAQFRADFAGLNLSGMDLRGVHTIRMETNLTGVDFLPSAHQGTLFRPEGKPVLNLRRPKDVTADDQRAQLDLMAKLNGAHLRDRPGAPDLSARIESFELAYRMPGEAADLLDLSKETATTRKMYGLDDAKARSFGTKCLTARRLIERGVRFVQVYSDGEWDAHSDLAGNHSGHCAATDVPIDGLLTDLKARGLLDSTLVIWGGEFGRMPVSQGNGGRDHNPQGFLVLCHS